MYDNVEDIGDLMTKLHKKGVREHQLKEAIKSELPDITKAIQSSKGYVTCIMY